MFLEVYEDALGGFGTEIYGVLCVLGDALEGLEHQVELTDICKVMFAACRAWYIVIFDEVHHLFLRPSVYRALKFNAILLAEVFNDLICAETFMTFPYSPSAGQRSFPDVRMQPMSAGSSELHSQHLHCMGIPE